VCRWAKIYDWLTDEGGLDRWAESDQTLVKTLITFLWESELMSENPTLSDFAAARLYLCGGSYARIAETLDVARQEIKTRFSKGKPAEFPNNPPKTESDPEAGWLFDWCRLGSGPFISWGFYFIREGSEIYAEYEPAWTNFEGAYVAVEFPGPVKSPKGGGFGGWHFPTWTHHKGDDFEVFKLVSLSDLNGDFTTAFTGWIAAQFEEAQKLIAAVAGEKA
jgi:hypothetical protein